MSLIGRAGKKIAAVTAPHEEIRMGAFPLGRWGERAGR